MKKRAQVTLFILIAVVLVGGVIILTQLREKSGADVEIHECNSDSDCIPDSCFNAQNCMPNITDLDCTDITQDPGAVEGLILGRACACKENKCEVE